MMLGSLTPLLQTLVGALAAILGGIVGAAVTYRLTIRLLRHERRDEALLELITHLPYLRSPVERVLEEHRRDPMVMIQTEGMARLKFDGWPRFNARWVEFLHPRIDDPQIRALYRQADLEITASEDVLKASPPGTNPPREEYWPHIEVIATSLRDLQERAEILLAKRSRWSHLIQRRRRP